MANDYRDRDGKRSPGRVQNCRYHQITIDGWPHIFVIAIRDIYADQELLVDYGTNFWTNLKCILEEHAEIETHINAECLQMLKEVEQHVGMQRFPFAQHVPFFVLLTLDACRPGLRQGRLHRLGEGTLRRL